MPITVVGTPTNTGNAQDVATIAPAVPTGAAVNDVAVVYLGQWQGGGAPTITAPSGFTKKGGFWTSGDAAAQNSIYWKRLTAADTGTYSFSWTGGTFWTTAQVVLFRGCITTGDPWDAVATPVTGTFGSITSMSVTLSGAGGALFWAVYNDSSGSHTPPTSFTEAADNDSGSCAYWIPGSSGSKSASGASISSSSPAGAWLGALLEAAGTADSPARPVRFAPGLYAPGGVLKPPPLGEATAVPNSIPSAANAAGTGQAFNAAVTISPAAGNAAGSGTAGSATDSISPVAGNAAGTGTAFNTTVTTTGSQSANAGNAAGTGTAYQPTVTVGVQAGNAAGTGAANQPTTTVAPNAGNAAGTGTAYDATAGTPGVAIDANQAHPQAAPMFFSPTLAAAQLAGSTEPAVAGSTSASAGLAAGTGTANNATTTVSVASGNAAGSGSANTATVTVSPAAGSATGTGAAGGAVDSIATNAGNAAGTGTANQPTVSTTGSQNAQAGNAAGTGTAGAPTPNVSASAGNAAGTGTASNARPNVGPSSGNAAGTGTAHPPTVVAPNATAGSAAGTGTANDATISTATSATAGHASGTGVASGAIIRIEVIPAAAAGTGHAHNTTNGVPVVAYPIRAAAITDDAERLSAAAVTDDAVRYHAGSPT